MFATALNLLPVGQLDGGHVLFALVGRAQKRVTNFVLLAMLPMGFLWPSWSFLAVMIYLFARKHPPLYDQTPIGAPRVRLAILALFIFLLCFSIAPLKD
jgi:membrane-associated protease RseP (regulator of RpoE activity)